VNWIISARGRLPIQRSLLLVLACGVLVGCSNGATQAAPAAKAPHGATSSQSQPPSRAEAPTAFDAAKGTRLSTAANGNTSIGGDQEGAAPVALSGYTAFITTGTAVQVLDTVTGSIVGSVAPKNQVPNPAGQGGGLVGSAAAAPLVIEVGGGQVALAGYVVQLPGHGTTPAPLAVEVDAVTASAKLAWNIVAPLPGQPGQAPSLSGGADVDLVGASGTTVVGAVGDSEDGYSTVAVDVATRKALWQSQSFLAAAVVGGTVIGTTDTAAPSGSLGSHATADTLNLAGLSAAQGKAEWQQSESISAANVQQAGPDQVMVEAADSSSGNDVISVLNAASGKGKTIANQPGETADSLPWTCAYAGQSVVVCDNGGGTQASADFAVDGTTGNTLWQLPDASANRTALTITSVYDGEVYGKTQASAVVLNAQTGKDVNDSPGVAPVVVDPDVGVGISSTDSQLEAYPATAP
jgi:hypothetical protein